MDARSDRVAERADQAGRQPVADATRGGRVRHTVGVVPSPPAGRSPRLDLHLAHPARAITAARRQLRRGRSHRAEPRRSQAAGVARPAVTARWLLCLAAACSGGAPQIRAKPTPVHLDITAGKDANQGGTFYVVVRKIDQAGFLAEDYDAIADRLFAAPPDPAVLRKAIVRPGAALTVDADRDLAEGEILGVYFLFSVPGDAWRLAIADRNIHRVRIVLGAAGIVSAEQQ
ncbi:MAG: hypothetical protein E6J91_05135 [Deltaproteobacteria bacterium]|nr:MAG: hypothetical protein E6J91_05135 [Deltaproteobacteria bacterium]